MPSLAGRILIIEDDAKLGQLLEEFLVDHGFEVRWERRGDLGKQALLEQPPDLLILDLTLPGVDGMDVCREVRPRFGGGIIILTARQSLEAQLAGLNGGADDYVIKPPNPPVLLARIRTLLRRLHSKQPNHDHAIQVGALQLDKSRLRVTVDDKIIDLTPTEFRVIWCLAEHVGEVVTREVLFRAALSVSWDGLDRRVDTYMSRIRRKLYDAGLALDRLKSIRGEGYLLVPP